MPDATYIPTSLPPEPVSIFYYLKLNSGIGHQETCSQPCKGGICHQASVVFFQVHGGMVSHMQVLATPSSTVA